MWDGSITIMPQQKSNDELLKDGINLQKKGRYLEALALYNSILDSSPKNPVALSEKSLVLAFMKNAEQAEECSKQAMTYDEKNLEIHINRARVLYGLDKFKDALAEYNRILQLSSDNAEVLLRKSICLTDIERLANTKRKEEILLDAKKVLDNNPNNPELKFLYGLTLYGLEKFKDAIKYFLEVHSAD